MAPDETFLKNRVDTLFGTTFNAREGRVIPATDDVVLKDGAVKIEAAFLYADLGNSALLSQAMPMEYNRKGHSLFLRLFNETYRETWWADTQL